MQLSQDFLEKATLLLLTAGLSGFFIPFVLKQIDERKLREQKSIDARRLREQKEFEANLARDNNVLEAQIRLLENLSKALWELQLLSLAVSYYQVHLNEDRYEIALKDYDKNSWGLFKDVRCEISKAARLASDEQYQNLLIFFSDHLVKEMDEKLMYLIKDNNKEGRKEEWEEYYSKMLYTFPKEIDKVITPLAQELKLASPNSSKQMS